MAWRTAGSLSRSLSRVSSLRSPPPMPRLRPPQAASRHQARRFSVTNPRNFAVIGSTASFLPLHSVATVTNFTSHLSVNPRAFSELSHGMEKMGDARGSPNQLKAQEWCCILLEGAMGSAQPSARIY